MRSSQPNREKGEGRFWILSGCCKKALHPYPSLSKLFLLFSVFHKIPGEATRNASYHLSYQLHSVYSTCYRKKCFLISPRSPQVIPGLSPLSLQPLLCPTLSDPMHCSTPGSSVLCYLPEFVLIHVFWVKKVGVHYTRPYMIFWEPKCNGRVKLWISGCYAWIWNKETQKTG